jgi:hypothetical protein
MILKGKSEHWLGILSQYTDHKNIHYMDFVFVYQADRMDSIEKVTIEIAEKPDLPVKATLPNDGILLVTMESAHFRLENIRQWIRIKWKDQVESLLLAPPKSGQGIVIS